MTDAETLIDDLKFELSEYELRKDDAHWSRLRAAIQRVIDDVPYELCDCGGLGGEE